MSGQEVKANEILTEQSARVTVYEDGSFFLFGKDTIKEAQAEIRARGLEVTHTHVSCGKATIAVVKPVSLSI